MLLVKIKLTGYRRLYKSFSMEETGVMSEETWSSFSGRYTNEDESEFLSQFLSGFSCPNDLSEIWPSDTSSLVCSSEFCNSNECLMSQETSILSPDDGQSVLYLDGSFFNPDDVSEGFERPRYISRIGDFDYARTPVFYCLPAGEPLLKSYTLEGFSDQYDISDIGKLEKQELDVDQPPRRRELPNAIAVANAPESKKRSRNVTDVARSKRNLKSDTYQKVVSENATKNDESNTVTSKKSSPSHSSEEHSSVTHEVTNGETHTIKTSKVSGGKGKGASSDPQSLYARKRRERINERLRILQGLVPNGTKVDISTMLEEAVHYVKFLQLQIKLLSSDDTWMYAPLAYNGMDIGITNFDITTTNTTPR